MSKFPKGIAPRDMMGFVKDKAWMEAHKSILEQCNKEIKSTFSSLKAKPFSLLFRSSLQQGEFDTIRTKLVDWYILALRNILWAHQSKLLSVNEHKSDNNHWANELALFNKYEIPLDKDTYFRMTETERDELRDAVLVSTFLASKRDALETAHVSGHFFAYEAALKSTAALSCIKFLQKLFDNDIIQHRELLTFDIRLGSEPSFCRWCIFKQSCPERPSFVAFAEVYKALIYMRMLVDYMPDKTREQAVRAYLIGDFFTLSQEALFLIHEYNDLISFLFSPITLRTYIANFDILLSRRIVPEAGKA